MNFFSQHIVRSMQIIVNITKLFLTISIENSYIEKKDVLNNKYIIYSQCHIIIICLVDSLVNE